MRTVVLGSPPDEVEQLIRRRREQGLDTFDEVWEGNYHVAPAGRARHAFLDDAVAVLLHPYAEAAGLYGSGPFNLGAAEDYRVPDRGYHTARPDVIYFDTAAVVVEIVSPDDETYAKFDFYAAHHVGEIIVVEPDDHRVRMFLRDGERYAEVAHSAALGAEAAALEEAIAWP